MAKRQLTISPFVDPSDAVIDPMNVRIELVDEDNRRISGLIAPDGTPIADLEDLVVGSVALVTDIWPQSDIEGLPAFGSSASSASYYLVTLERPETHFRVQMRTQVADGGALDWLEFIHAAGPVTPPDLSVDQLIADVIASLEADGRLLPVPANEGDVLVYTGGAWTATDTLSGGSA